MNNSEYEYWVKNRKVVSPRTDELLNKILEGHTLTEVEGFEMICDDKERIDSYVLFNNLRNKILKEKNISEDDFNLLCTMMDLDPRIRDMAIEDYKKEGIIR